MATKQLVFLLTFSVLGLSAAVGDLQFVCYDDPECAANITRPVFTEGVSVEECCEMPHITSVWDRLMESCMDCGPPSVERITPQNVALTPPETLTLEVKATGFARITWFHAGPNGEMLDLQRLELENFSKRLVVFDTVPGDQGLYEADVHTLDGGILTVGFIVGTFVPPSISSVSEGGLSASGYVNLSCTATGNPAPTVTWVYNDSELPADQTLTTNGGSVGTLPLVTAVVEVYAEGAMGTEKYFCVAVTTYSDTTFSDEDSLYLQAVPPEVQLRIPQEDEIVVTVSNSVEFFCFAVGSPVPLFHWEKDGTLVETEGRIRVVHGHTTSTLQIQSIIYEDAGNYSCIASNIEGEDSALFLLSLLAPPNVTAWPKEEVVNIHDSAHTVVYMCRAFGFPLPNVTWLSEEVVLSGYCEGLLMEDTQGSGTLGGDNTTMDDLQDMIDMMGEAPEEMMTQAPPNTNGTSMGTLLPTDCHVSSMVIDSDTVVSMLTVYSANMEQSSNFTCVAKNEVENNIGSPENATVQLVIVATPFFLARPRTTVNTVLSLYVQLTCTVIGQTTPVVTWYKEDAVIEDGDWSRVRVTSGGNGTTVVSVLAISLVEVGDRGQYTCEASNEDGVDSVFSNLNVRVPANITLSPANTQVQLFTNATFICEAYGFPMPIVYWARMVGGSSELEYLSDITPEGPTTTNTSTMRTSVISSNVTEGVVSSMLMIQNVQSADEGAYLCLTSNGVVLSNLTTIKENASATLVIQVPPVITTPPEDTTVIAPNPALLTCTARGIPQPEVYWLREGVRLTNSERITITQTEAAEESIQSSLEINDTHLGDAGLYHCVVENTIGTESADGQLIVHSSPAVSITPPFGSVVLIGSIVTFECEAMGVPPPEITWFYDDRQLTGLCREIGGNPVPEMTDHCLIAHNTHATSTVATLTIDGVLVEDDGVYTCVANNSLGRDGANTSLSVVVQTTVQVTIENHIVVEGGSFSIMCAAFGKPTPQLVWLKDSTPVQIAIANSQRHSVSDESNGVYQRQSVLTVMDVLLSDGGEYKCRIDNHNISNQPIVGSLQITVQSINECVLSVDAPTSPCQNNATCIDEIGRYRCVCVDDFTGVNCTEKVSVPESPTIINDPEDFETELFQSISLTCEASGQPDPVYSWYRDELFLFNTSEPDLFIPEAKPEDRGKYTCVAHNIYGNSNTSRPGLVTISGVFQYVVNFTECNGAEDFTVLLSQLSDCLSGRTLEVTMGTIYSITPRPTRMGQVLENQIIITVVINASTSEGIMEDLQDRLTLLSDKFECQFTHLERYDGCPYNIYVYSEEYSVFVPWSETAITQDVSTLCPCGNLDASIYQFRNLARTCGGTYTYGAQWEMVQDGCDFSLNTLQLCNVTTLAMEEQSAALEEATQQAVTYSPLDFAIAATIMQNLAESTVIEVDELIQRNFTRSFDNLLETSSDSISKSQEEFQASEVLLDSLGRFAHRIELGLNATSLFIEEDFQMQVQNIPITSYSGQNYTPQFDTLKFQKNAVQTPIQGASMSLPDNLVEDLTMDNSETLRVFSSVMLTDSLFVLNESSVQALQLASSELTLGNVIISASLSGYGRVENLSEPVRIYYTQTQGLNETNITDATCVFWKTQIDSPYGRWSGEGCELVSQEKGEIVCQCYHLTHFGLLLDIDPAPDEDEEVQLSLEIITYIGIILSIICLLIILITYIGSKKLHSRVVGKILIHMCIALIALYVAFLIAMHGKYYNNVTEFCYFSSILLQYFLLVYLFWTSIQAFHLYLKLVKIFWSDPRHFVLKTAIVAWGLPAIIVTASSIPGIMFDLYAVYVDEDLFFCRPVEWPFYFGIILPFIVIFLFNFTMFFIIMCSLTKSMHKRNKLNEKGEKQVIEYKKLTVIAFFLLVIFGIGWIFAFLVPTHELLSGPQVVISTIAQYIFSIVIGFQGVLVFILHGVRSPDVRKKWKLWFCTDYLWCVDMPAHHSTTTGGRKKEYTGGETVQNPVYDSHENINTASTFVHGHDTTPKMSNFNGESDESGLDRIEGLSYASETVLIEFNRAAVEEETSDREEDFSILKELTSRFQISPTSDYITTSFSVPSGDAAGYVMGTASAPEVTLKYTDITDTTKDMASDGSDENKFSEI